MVPTVGLGIYQLVNVVKLHYNGPYCGIGDLSTSKRGKATL